MRETERIENNKRKVCDLLNKNIDLEYKSLLKRCHRFHEKEINLGTKKEPKMVIAKYGCWYEWFKDEDKPDEKGVRIERNVVVSINGKKSNGYRLIEYYEPKDI